MLQSAQTRGARRTQTCRGEKEMVSPRPVMSLPGKNWQLVYTGMQDMSWYILKEDGFDYLTRISYLFLSLLLNDAVVRYKPNALAVPRSMPTLLII